MSGRPAESESARLVIAFAAVAHCLHHIIVALFLTIVLILSATWQRPYEELIALWTFGALLLGAAAPLAGWISDRCGETRVMIANFLGLGASSVLCGLADGPGRLEAALLAMGLFGAIYHPVGTAWVVRHAQSRGRAIAIVGAAGSVGVALASVTAGALTDLLSWRAAFIIPGAVSIVLGGVLWWVAAQARIVDPATRAAPLAPEASEDARAALRQGVIALVIAMALTSVVWQAFVTMLPKWLGREIGASLPPGLTSIGAVVTAVFLVGSLAQFAGGALADRGYAKETYVASFVLKLAAFALALATGGWPVLIAAVIIVWVFDIAAPIENLLIARFSPPGRTGVAYGLRFGITIVSGPIGVQLVAHLYHEDGRGFAELLWVLAAIVAVIVIAATLIPGERQGDRARAVQRRPAAG